MPLSQKSEPAVRPVLHPATGTNPSAGQFRRTTPLNVENKRAANFCQTVGENATSDGIRVYARKVACNRVILPNPFEAVRIATIHRLNPPRQIIRAHRLCPTHRRPGANTTTAPQRFTRCYARIEPQQPQLRVETDSPRLRGKHLNPRRHRRASTKKILPLATAHSAAHCQQRLLQIRVATLRKLPG